MTLNERFGDDLKEALKKGDSGRVSTLRMLIAALRNYEIEKKVKQLEDVDIYQILQRQIKQHKDSIEQFSRGSRQDLADKEEAELAILESYMPPQLDRSQIIKLIDEAMAESGASTKRDAGKVMKLVMEKAKGRADGKSINALVMERLK